MGEDEEPDRVLVPLGARELEVFADFCRIIGGGPSTVCEIDGKPGLMVWWHGREEGVGGPPRVPHVQLTFREDETRAAIAVGADLDLLHRLIAYCQSEQVPFRAVEIEEEVGDGKFVATRIDRGG